MKQEHYDEARKIGVFVVYPQSKLRVYVPDNQTQLAQHFVDIIVRSWN